LKQFVKQGLFLVHEKHYLSTDLGQTLSRKFPVQVIGGAFQFLLRKRHVQPNYLVMNNIRCGDQND